MTTNKTLGLVGGTSWVSTMDDYRLIAALAARGAESAILGCTEIPLVVKPEDTSTPTFDTTEIHAESAVSFALA